MTLEVADNETHALFRRVMEECHPDLRRSNVTVGVLFHKADSPLRHKGRNVEAFIRITSTKERAFGAPDCVVTIDHKVWTDHDDDAKDSLADHELEHIKIKRFVDVYKNEGGKLVLDIDPVTDEVRTEAERDDQERPKLKSIPHDWEIVGFDAVVERRGIKSREIAALHLFADTESGQRIFAFLNGGEMKAAANGPPRQYGGRPTEAAAATVSEKQAEKAKARRKGLAAV